MKRALLLEGIEAFYVLFTVVHFATYNATKIGLIKVDPESMNDERRVVHTMVGVATEAWRPP